MGFKIPKFNKWNYWNDLVNWKEVHDSFSIDEVNGKYELIFNYKDSSKEEYMQRRDKKLNTFSKKEDKSVDDKL